MKNYSGKKGRCPEEETESRRGGVQRTKVEDQEKGQREKKQGRNLMGEGLLEEGRVRGIHSRKKKA